MGQAEFAALVDLRRSAEDKLGLTESRMSILRRLFGRAPKPKRQNTALAMPLFLTQDPPDIREALRWVRERFPDSSSFGEPDGEAETFTVAIPGGQLGMTFVPMPVPANDLLGPNTLAWHWPSAASVVAGHVAHQILFASSSELDYIELRLLHSRVIAGIVACGHACGVYVGSGMLVREGGAYVQDNLAADRDNLPLLSWIGFNPVMDGGSRSAYTTGLSDFGLLELEVRTFKGDFAETFELLADIAHYQITSGVQIGDGETVGGSDAERIVVRHLASRYIPKTTVACIQA